MAKDDDKDDKPDPGKMAVKVKAPAGQALRITVTPQKKRKSLIDTMTGLRS